MSTQDMMSDEDPADFSTYEEWMAAVDRHVTRLTGWCTTDDLPDQPYYDWYEANVHPRAAADRAMPSGL